jgi:hypothetical protein
LAVGLVFGGAAPSPKPFTREDLQAVLPCMEDLAACGDGTLRSWAAETREARHLVTRREQAWLVATACTRDPGLCRAGSKAFQAALQQVTGPWTTLATAAVADRPRPNTIFTHGFGLQPDDVEFPYDGPFPFTGVATKLKGTSQASGHPPVFFTATGCEPVFAVQTKEAQRCTVTAPAGWDLCRKGEHVAVVTILPGRWDPVKGFSQKPKYLTISCGGDPKETDSLNDGAIAKCIGFDRFCPTGGVDTFQACVRGVTAQYCGGNCKPSVLCSHTKIGMVLDLYTQQPQGSAWTNPSGEPSAICPSCKAKTLCAEAQWTQHRASAVYVERLGTLPVKCRGEFQPHSGHHETEDAEGDAGILFTRSAPDGGCPAQAVDPDCPSPPLPGCGETVACH